MLRYRRVTDPNGATAWQPVPDEYALGFPGVLRNGNGGVAIGYGYTPDGRIDRTACSAFLWSTGEQLRKANDPSLAARLAAGGPPNVDGLQGNGINLVRPANEPPLATYFVDYDDKFNDDDARGHLGDVAIWRQCGGQAAFAPVVEPEAVGFDLIGGGFGECRERVFDRDGYDRDGRRRPINEREWLHRCCDWQWEHHGNDRERVWLQRCCERDWVRGGNDRDWERRCFNPPSTCPPGTIVLPNGTCCDPKYVRRGVCLPPPVNTCPPGTIKLPNGTCCDPQNVRRGVCLPPPSTCPPGTVKQPNGTCEPVLKRTPRKILEREPHDPGRPVITGHNPTINIPRLPIKPNGGITRVPSNPIGGHGMISMPHIGGLGGGKAIR